MDSTRRRLRYSAVFLWGLLAAGLGACVDGSLGLPPENAIDLASPWVSQSADAVGMDANGLFMAGETAQNIDRLRSLLVVRRGKLVLERYYGGASADSLADVRSVTKSIVSTLVGIAFEEGSIDGLDQPVTDFLSGDEFLIRPEHEGISIGHLLTMTSGLDWSENTVAGYGDWITSGDHVNYVLERTVGAPGESFVYSSGAVHLLGVIVEKAVDRPLERYAAEVLFGPLGIDRVQWEDLVSGYPNGGSGIDLRPRDLARLGQLHLQQGWSGARSVVPATWIDRSVAPSRTGLGSAGAIRDLSYGFLWWLDPTNGAYLAWGFGGQFIYVVPGEELVVVATTEWRGVRQDIGSQALQERVLALIIDGVLPTVRR